MATADEPRKFKLHKVNQETYAKAIKELMTHPSTAHDLVEVTGLHVVTVQHLMRTFLRHKIIHVSAWDVDGMGRDTTQVYTFGPGRNVPRRKKTPAERTAAYRVRKQLKLLTITPALHAT